MSKGKVKSMMVMLSTWKDVGLILCCKYYIQKLLHFK